MKPERDDAVMPIPEPHRSLFAFLSDLWEQADMISDNFASDPLAAAIIEELQTRIAGLAVLLKLPR
jgi:hypothetical protein